jgi:hypothetical protein
MNRRRLRATPHPLPVAGGATARTLPRTIASWVASASIAIAPVSCKKTPEEAPAAQAAPTAEGSSPIAGEVAPPVEQPADPSRFTEEPIAYPIALEPLLDLVPANEKSFVAIRDPKLALALYDAYVLQQIDTLLPLTEQSDSDFASEQKKMRASADLLRGTLDDGAIDASKGALILERGQTVIYGASDPQTLPRLLAKLDAGDVPKHCAAIEGAEGYAACSVDESVLAEMTSPGKQGAALALRIAERQAGVDLDRANVVALFDTPSGPLAGTVATTAAQLHVAFSMGDLGQPIGEAVAANRSKVLGLVAPGAAFVWGQANMQALQPQLASAGPPMSTVGATLTGEALFGGLDSGGLALLAGVDDPYPASGLISMAAMQLDALPKELDDGTKLSVALEKIEVAGKEAQVIHATLSGSPQVATMNKFGLAGDAYLFAAGKFAGLVFGGKVESVKRAAEFVGGGATEELLRRLPVPLARALDAGDAAWATHLPLDGLQVASMADQLAEGLALASADTPLGLDPSRLANAMLTAMAPFSSLSVWMTHPHEQRVLHLFVDGIIEVGSEEGKAVTEAITAIAGGADRNATYGALASSHASSPRAMQLRARAGDDPAALTSAMTVAFVTGMLAAIAIPAFQSYLERAAAAGLPQ